MDFALLLPAHLKPVYQRDQFLSAYATFCAARGAKFSDVLHIRRLPVDAYELWAAVREQGGHHLVSSRKLWAAIARSFNHPASWTNASHYFKATYESSGLGGLEDLVDAGRFSIPAAAFVDAPGEQQQPEEGDGEQLQQQAQEQDFAAVPESLLAQLHGSSSSLEAAPAAAAAGVRPAEAGSSGSSRGTFSQQQLVPLLRPGEAARAVLDVTCGPAVGVFDMARQRVFCHCNHCKAEAGPTGVEMVPTEFERHGGLANFKKWKKSIIVVETGRNIGCWMVEHGLIQRASRSKAAKAAAAAAKAAGSDAAATGAIGTAPWQVGGSSSSGIFMPAAHQAAAGAADPLGLMSHRTGQQQQQQQQFQQGMCAGGGAAGDGVAPCQRPPRGFELVGRVIRVWWPLDAAWYEAAVEGYQPEQDLHTIRYSSDGELEQLSLSQEQWQWQQPQPQPPLPHMLPHAAAARGLMQQDNNQAEQQQQQQQHVALPLLKAGSPAGPDGFAAAAAGSPNAAAAPPSAAAACNSSPDHSRGNDISLLCEDGDGYDGSGEDDEEAAAAAAGADADAAATAAWQAEQQAWLAAAQWSVINRPLRVVWDSAAGCLRVLLAAELLSAEFEMRRHLKRQQMEQLLLAQQQQRQEASQQQQQQSGQKRPREESASCDCSKSPGECAPWAAAGASALGVGSPTSGASTAGSSVAALYDGEGFKVPASKPAPQQSTVLPAATAGHGSESLPAAGNWQQPTGWSVQQQQQQWQAFEQPQPQLQQRNQQQQQQQQQQPSTPLAALPSSVPVVCGERRGSFMLSTRDVICHCHECDREHRLTGVYIRWAPAEFECHGGLAASRKWKNTLRVELQEGRVMGIGRWLERAGLEPPANRPQRPPARPKPAAAAVGLKRPLAVQPQQVQQLLPPPPSSLAATGLEAPAAKRQALGLPLHEESTRQQQQQQQQQQQAVQASGSSADWMSQHQQEAPLHQVLRCDDGFEVMLLLPDSCSLPDISMRAWDDGRLLLRATASAAGSSGPGPADGQPGQQHQHQQQPFERLIQLPGRIVSSSASALLAPSGRELFVRVQECRRPVMTAAAAAAEAAAAAAAAAGYASVSAGRI